MRNEPKIPDPFMMIIVNIVILLLLALAIVSLCDAILFLGKLAIRIWAW